MELGYHRPNDITCTTDIEKLKKCTIEDQVYMFLASLDKSMNQVRSQILATSPLPFLEEAYSLIHHEIQRYPIMGT